MRHPVQIAHTNQTGATGQSLAGAYAAQAYASGHQSAEVCIIGDGIQSLALSALYSLNTSAQGLTIKLLSGVVPAHIEFSSLLSTLDKVIVGRTKSASKYSANNLTLPAQTARVEEITQDPVKGLERVNQVILSCPATAYGAVAGLVGPSIYDGMTLALVGAPLFGALQFDFHLKQSRPDLIINIVELDHLFDRAEKNGNDLTMRGLRRRVNISGRSRNETRRAMPLAQALSPSLLPSSNLLERGLFDIDATVRPVLVLSALMGGRVEKLADLPEFLNRSNLQTLSEIERELSKLTFVYKSSVVDFTRIFREQARANSDFKPVKALPDSHPVSSSASLSEAVIAACGAWFGGLTWTYGLAQEVLSRYVEEQLVLISELGRKANIAMPVLDSVIDLASAVIGYDLRKDGRTLAE
jgi:hypothetical protein